MNRRILFSVSGLILLLYLSIHIWTLPLAPLTDDDDFYIPAAADYVAWLARVVTFDGDAFNRSAIDAAFDANHEHPPVAKYVLGVCGFLFKSYLGPVSAPRVGTTLFSTLAAAMMLWMAVAQLGARRGLLAGGLGVLFLLLTPRFFFHGRVATLDVPVAGMYTAAAALALRAEHRRWPVWVLGPVFGLATATKLNAPFLVVPYVLFAVLVRGGTARASGGPGSGKSLRLPSLPAGLASMAVLGPLTFFAVWPWMWFDVVDRVSDYVRFHLGHYGIYFLYFGRLYEKDPFAPWHMPIVMASITVPLAISALAGTGLVAGLRSALQRVYWGDAARHADPSTKARLREGELVLWLGLNAMSCLAVVAFSGGAKYGGAKLFMPFFPFWALLAGYGALRLIERARASMGRWSLGGTAAALTMVVLASVSHHHRFRDTPLSQYNALVDGLRGATAAGFERQYYDLAFRDLVSFISKEAPQGTSIYFLPNNWEYRRTFPWYRKEGTLRTDVRVVGSEREADWVVITHERRFRRYGGDLIRARKSPILKEKRVDGVPLWTILERRQR